MIRILFKKTDLLTKIFARLINSSFDKLIIFLMTLLSFVTLVNAQQVGTGLGYHSLVLNEDGQIYGWGGNYVGQLGMGDTYSTKVVPVATDRSGVLSGKNIVRVEVGGHHSIVLDSNGKVYTWGGNDDGQLGSESLLDRSTLPVAVADGTVNFSGRTVTSISAGLDHSIAAVQIGKVFTWGRNDYGQLGNDSEIDSNVPVEVDRSGVLNGKTIVKVYGGGYFSAVIDSDGKVYTWGDNTFGQLGTGVNSSFNKVPVAVVDGDISFTSKTIADLAAGNSHVLVIDSDGKVYGWGYNQNGQLGNANNTSKNVPVAVADGSNNFTGKTIIAVAAGTYHSMALDSEGKVYTWGRNNYGQLGNGSYTNSNVPVEIDMSGVLSGQTIIAIGAGYYHSIAVASDGRVYGWGLNNYGQLGNGTIINSNVPVEVDISSMGGLITSVPAVQAGNVTFSNVISHSMDISCTKGSGSRRAVFMRQGTGEYNPTDNVTYAANSVFGSGDQIDVSGWFCIYKGTGTSVNVTGLNPSTNYSVRVYEYNGSNGSESYLTTAETNNPAEQQTNALVTPTTQAQSIIFSDISALHFDIEWTNGNGEKRTVFIKQGNSGNALPVDNTTYSANSIFGSGSQIGTTGWYCIYNGSGTSAVVTGLSRSTDYIVQVLEYNGKVGNEQYLTSGATDNPISQTTSSNPNYSLSFDGSNDYVSIPFNASLNPATFTVECWAQVNGGNGAYRAVLASRCTPAKGMNFYATEANVWSAWIGTGIVGVWGQVNGPAVVNGEWAHLAMTYDEATTTLKFYVNGVLQGSQNTAFSPNISSPLMLGSINDSGTPQFFFNGKIDDVRLWSVVRTEEQINNYKDTELNGDESGLVVYYKLNEGSGSTIFNSAAESFNGTLASSPNNPTWVSSDAPLPVELISFSATSINSADGETAIVLEWSTATEVNNYGFSIERLVDSSGWQVADNKQSTTNNWQAIGFVQGHGNSNSPKCYEFIDNQPPTGNLQYRLKQIDTDGSYEYFATTVQINSLTDLQDGQLPSRFSLEQNYPNPFNPTTTIDYAIHTPLIPLSRELAPIRRGDAEGRGVLVVLKVYDILGREVATLVNEYQHPGNYEVKFDGSSLSSGIYYYRLEAGGYSQTRKLMLLK